jgi:hypothetical protein
MTEEEREEQHANGVKQKSVLFDLILKLAMTEEEHEEQRANDIY